MADGKEAETAPKTTSREASETPAPEQKSSPTAAAAAETKETPEPATPAIAPQSPVTPTAPRATSEQPPVQSTPQGSESVAGAAPLLPPQHWQEAAQVRTHLALCNASLIRFYRTFREMTMQTRLWMTRRVPLRLLLLVS